MYRAMFGIQTTDRHQMVWLPCSIMASLSKYFELSITRHQNSLANSLLSHLRQHLITTLLTDPACQNLIIV